MKAPSRSHQAITFVNFAESNADAVESLQKKLLRDKTQISEKKIPIKLASVAVKLSGPSKSQKRI